MTAGKTRAAYSRVDRRCALTVALGATILGMMCVPAGADGRAGVVVDQLSVVQFRQRMIDLSTIPAFPGSTTPTRYWNQPGNLEAVAYIKAKLESYGYTNVTLDPYTFSNQVRHNIYATKMGSAEPRRMYIVSGHMDSYSTVNVADAPGFDDDGSGTALVLELARVFAKLRTDISVRFILWNNEETGLNGSRAYVSSHRLLQGTLAEPTWVGVIQHDMILYDRFPVPDADIEYSAARSFGGGALILATFVAGAMGRYGSIPAQVGSNMCCTDSVPFADYTTAISVRENQRVAEIGQGSNPNWHKPTDRFETYSTADIQFGFNLVKMSAGAVAELTNAEPDCNMNDIGDADDIANGAIDFNGDGIPDACQDCNANGALDPVEIAGGMAMDCNHNGVPDGCDIAATASLDCDSNAVPDECEPDWGPTFARDIDGDGHYGPGSCLLPNDDCNDTDANNYPGNSETCDLRDNDCDSLIDEGLTFDNDGDGHTTPGSCSGTRDDCDDDDANNFPGNPEVCDRRDNDCDGRVDILRIGRWQLHCDPD